MHEYKHRHIAWKKSLKQWRRVPLVTCFGPPDDLHEA